MKRTSFVKGLALLAFGFVMLGTFAATRAVPETAKKDSSTTTKTTTTTTTAAAPAHPTMTMKEAKQKLGIIVFPAKGQSAAQQEADEVTCLEWGANETGISTTQKPTDAKAAGQAAAAKTDSATQGVAVKSAAKGAAVGAVIGSISGNAGAGAAYGATAGALGGRKAKKQATAQAAAKTEAQVEAENKFKKDKLKVAMGTCLEAKGYTVK
ncbi:MAG: hypothetical protein HYR73_04650 [Candidatus Eisenbacteria bacterium]|nr:hypothetical protein [Candidatus Eisenbacteria bacterium]